MQNTSLTDAERDGLRGIRSRRRWVWRVWLGAVPVAALVALIAGERAFNAAAIAIMVAWCIVFLRSGFVRCPRCAAFFNLGRLRSANPFRRECGSCGLSLHGV